MTDELMVVIGDVRYRREDAERLGLLKKADEQPAPAAVEAVAEADEQPAKADDEQPTEGEGATSDDDAGEPGGPGGPSRPTGNRSRPKPRAPKGE